VSYTGCHNYRFAFSLCCALRPKKYLCIGFVFCEVRVKAEEIVECRTYTTRHHKQTELSEEGDEHLLWSEDETATNRSVGWRVNKTTSHHTRAT
jgi:hypothetical protein